MNRYGCYNRPPLHETLEVQEGWTEDGKRIMKTIPFVMSMECEYRKDHNDPKCGGCKCN